MSRNILSNFWNVGCNFLDFWSFLAAFGIPISISPAFYETGPHNSDYMNIFQSAVEFSGEYQNSGRLWAGSNLARICLPTVPRKGSLLLLFCKYLNNNNFMLTCSRLQDWVGKAHREKVRKNRRYCFQYRHSGVPASGIPCDWLIWQLTSNTSVVCLCNLVSWVLFLVSIKNPGCGWSGVSQNLKAKNKGGDEA